MPGGIFPVAQTLRIPFLRRRRPARTESRVWSAVVDRALREMEARCRAQYGTLPIPTFTWSTANYPAATLHTYSFPSGYAAFSTFTPWTTRPSGSGTTTGTWDPD